MKDVITVFHKPSISSSTRVVTFLKQHQANAQNPATEDQASDKGAAPPTQRADYDLDIQEQPPTGDQLKSILQYVGPGKAGTIVQGARDVTDAIEKVKRDGGLFNRPLVWHLMCSLGSKSERRADTPLRSSTGIRARWPLEMTRVRS